VYVHAFECDSLISNAYQVARSGKANKIHLLAHAQREHDDHLLCLVTDSTAELWDLRMCQGPAASCVSLDNGTPQCLFGALWRHLWWLKFVYVRCSVV
jgi:hypothetical protein